MNKRKIRYLSIDNGIVLPDKKYNEEDFLVIYKCYCCGYKNEFYIPKNTKIIKCKNCGAGTHRTLLRKIEIDKKRGDF